MKADLGDLNAFVAVARAGGFVKGRALAAAAPLSSAKRCVALEAQLGVRLLNRTTRSVVPTEAGKGLLERLGPALSEVESALDVVNGFRDRPAGALRLNVPVSAARLVLPAIVPPFLAVYPDIRLEVVTDENFVDVIAAGCDAGIRYDERLEQDMIRNTDRPTRPALCHRRLPDYLDRRGRPQHPSELLGHACILGRFDSGAMTAPWEFERDGEIVRVDPTGPLIVRVGGATDLAVDAAISGTGIVCLFEDWLRPHFDSGALEPILEPWWQRFSGPFLYYPGRRLVPAPLRAFIDFVKASASQA
ncbi:LysR substrate-binding domain-containing protein [Rhizobium beringeri]